MKDVADAANARWENGRWVGPWETERCEHGVSYRARWVLRRRASRQDRRPTVEDFEDSEPEMESPRCAACHPLDDDCPAYRRTGEHSGSPWCVGCNGYTGG